MKSDHNDKIPAEDRPLVLRIVIRSDEHVFEELREQTDRLVENGTNIRTLSFGRVNNLRGVDHRVRRKALTHTQTVARVMKFLDDLKKDGVELTKRHGRKLIVIDLEVADRLTNHTRCDRGTGPTTTETMISS
jgi:histone H3/H4